MARFPVRLVAASTLVVFGLVVGSAASWVAAAGHDVAIHDSSFSPGTITIKVGDRITWMNRGSTDHNVTSEILDSGTMAPGGMPYSHTFKQAGTFTYVCTIHGFQGTVVVKGPASTAKPTPKPTATTAPAQTPTPTPPAAPTTLAASPSPSALAVASIPAGSPSSEAGGPGTPDSGGASSIGTAALILAALIAAGALGLAWQVNRRRR